MESKNGKSNVFEKVKTNRASNINKVIAVMSGKGGVGKSFVTSLIATSLKRKGKKVGILDADITGPSIPKMFGLNKTLAKAGPEGIFPQQTSTGIQVMSIELLLEKKDRPVIWRGPLLAGTVKQFYSDVIWGDLDYLLIDLPPGTGDIPLTIMQSLPVDGVVTVTAPQDLVQLIVAKSVNMVKALNVPFLGVVENMSYLECPECGKIINVFGKSKIEELVQEWGLKLLARLPIDPDLARLCDEGKVEEYTKLTLDLEI